MKSKKILSVIFALLLVYASALPCAALYAQNFPEGSTRARTEMSEGISPVDLPMIDLSIRQPETNKEVAFSVQLLLLLTILSLAPSILILVTCFLRFTIVFDFIKRALSLQQVPPTTVLNGIAFFLTLFVMWPVFTQMYESAYKPLSDGEIGLEQAVTNAQAPLRMFMFKQVSAKGNRSPGMRYIAMFMNMAKMEKPANLADVPTHVLIPSYILHELTIAFQIGVLLYIPFIIIDMVVASILMSMGMIMLPPVQISMPFKLMVFVLVDGWGLLTQQLFTSIVP